MAIAKMSVKQLEAFLLAEFPQAFLSGDISIESADGTTCLLRQRYSDQMLRPGGTVSGPDADGAGRLRHVCGAALGYRPGRTSGDRQPQYQFSTERCARAGRPCGSATFEARQAACGRRGQPVVGHLARSDRSCNVDLFHSSCLEFSTVISHHNYKLLLLQMKYPSRGIDASGPLI